MKKIIIIFGVLIAVTAGMFLAWSHLFTSADSKIIKLGAFKADVLKHYQIHGSQVTEFNCDQCPTSFEKIKFTGQDGDWVACFHYDVTCDFAKEKK